MLNGMRVRNRISGRTATVEYATENGIFVRYDDTPDEVAGGSFRAFREE